MSKPKVLLGCNAHRDANAGVAGTVLDIGAALERHGWEAHFQFAKPNTDPRIERQMTYLRTVASARRVKPRAAIIASGDGALFPLLRPGLPLIVHSHGLEHMVRAAWDAHELPHTFGLGHRYLREPAVGFASRRADAVVVQTKGQADFAIEMLRVHRDRVHVIPNSVTRDFFDIVPTGDTRPTVIWVGSWLSSKGSLWMPDVLADLLRRIPDAHLHLVGTGVSESDVRADFSGGQQPHLSVTSRASRDELKHALAGARVGLFTSAFEGFGRAPLEMAAAGLPLVSTDVGVASDLVKAGETGALIKFGAVHDAALRVADYLINPDIAAKHGAAARQLAHRFEAERVGAEWHELVSSVVH
ncbi:glycosyltransferase family 4 protein [Frigoribacterium sp. 2-23]|uniref:glycosyltransferase family 4 protein n=1 Tax=Frigoribacterium sp. 2-23 TaxID=3415006 RepID=UPI003C6EFEDC